MNSSTQAVTGAFGYSGRYIAGRLVDAGHQVITLTNSLHHRNPFGDRVRAHPFNFDDPARLAASLEGVDVLHNTYWVRFNHPEFSFAEAVKNSRILFDAAAEAGVRRVVHISITNPSLDSDLEYFRGKAEVEAALRDSGLAHSILRPAVLFGGGDILINNIAWFLRRFPIFAVFGDGTYRLQPIFVDDLARLAVEHSRRDDNVTIDAIGPETFTYRQLAATLADILGVRRPIVSVPPMMGYYLAVALSKLIGDVIVTRDEIEGLMRGLLHVESSAAGTTRLTDWAARNAPKLGTRYASELARRAI
ncbi:MAG: NAD(P)H-binding protein [Gemmatimonadetes bacterium]|uniref:NAD(P)H-binding protein n=1 Tax=Candidatus Kutchimonas denitrificans TaxID=3056748 RepID=A0AAE5CAS9_9BACT|nr:NAD(P)H-binding protein [Gemmatimonadota bacterium]NIR73668.1 NAD(P)H-binding protein [Candidatus Kutchimonas denitrificans]NIS00718.1 NAD(P)H-binding protein [Gemmatimonadota bacterium]NIT66305.1 NAD(P)H-binding protein [Gemmatimonadota bacterium]NIU51523.1 NAD(P)H-binding protein [Gemmatimonadota bacterium]